MFFKKIEDFTPATVQEALRPLYPDVDVTDVQFAGQHQGSASHLRLDLTYGPGSKPDLPARMFVKTLLDAGRDALPSGFSETLAGDLALSMYATEVHLYTLLQSEVKVEAPRVFATALGEGAGEFYLFLEDLNDRGAICPKVIPALEVQQVSSLLETLASLHASYWQDARLDALPWLERSTEGRLSRFLKAGGWDPIDIEFQIPYKAQILTDTGIDRAHMQEAFWRRQNALNGGPETLLHGDPHPGNVYFLPDGTVGLLDWQLARRGPLTHDVSYAIIAALDPADRRLHERALLNEYRAHLVRLGVSNIPSEAEIWLAHRQSPAWGLPMWGSTPEVMYSRAEVETVVRRFGVAWVDLSTSEALRF